MGGHARKIPSQKIEHPIFVELGVLPVMKKAISTIGLVTILVMAIGAAVRPTLRPIIVVTPGEGEVEEIIGYKLHLFGLDDTNKVDEASLYLVSDLGWESPMRVRISDFVQDIGAITNAWLSFRFTAYNSYGLESEELSDPIYINPKRPKKVKALIVYDMDGGDPLTSGGQRN